MSYKELKLAITVTLVATCAAAIFIDQSRVSQERSQEAKGRLAQAHVVATSGELKQIPITFTTTAPLRQYYNGRSTSFENIRFLEEWSLLETQDTVLINSSIAGAQLCPEALADFMASFSPKQMGTTHHVSYGMPIETLRDITKRMQGQVAQVRVRIPLFDAPPPGLEKCPGFNWADNTHRLTYRGKPVAVMVAKQPQLELPE